MSNHYTFRSTDPEGKVYNQYTVLNGRKGPLLARNFTDAMKTSNFLALAHPDIKIEALKNGDVVYTIEPTEKPFGSEVLY
jgi:hypothetical protein